MRVVMIGSVLPGRRGRRGRSNPPVPGAVPWPDRSCGRITEPMTQGTAVRGMESGGSQGPPAAHIRLGMEAALRHSTHGVGARCRNGSATAYGKIVPCSLTIASIPAGRFGDSSG